MVEIGERLEGTAAHKLAGPAYFAARHNPMNIVAGAAFNILLILQPARQFALGATQHTLLAGLMPKYHATSLYPNSLGLGLGLSVIDRPEAWARSGKLVAKALGMPEAEAIKFIRNFRNSGLIDIISSHTFARNGLLHLSTSLHSSKGMQAAHAVKDVAGGAVQLVQNAGFTAGESVNKGFSYLIAAERYRVANPGASVTDARAAGWIAAEAESLALNMTQVGKLSYQDGWFKLATQFLSFQHKAINQFAPQFMGGTRRYTPMEKSRMAVMQLGLWGAGGLGLGELWVHVRDTMGIELAPWEKAVVEDGMMETMMNAALNAYSDEDSHLDISKTFAPAGGAYSSYYGIVYNLLNADIPAFLSGASNSAHSKLADAAGLISHIYKRPDISTTKKLLNGVQAVGSIAGQYSKYTQMKLGMNLGYMVDSNGDRVVKATFNELLFKGVLGVSSQRESDYYAALKVKMGHFSEKEINDAHKEDAAMLYDRMSKVALLFEGEYEDLYGNIQPIKTANDAFKARLHAAIGVEASIWLAWDAQDAYAVRAEFRALLNKNEMSKTKSDKFIASLVNMLLKGNEGMDSEYFANKLKNSTLVAEERKPLMQTLWDKMMNNKQTLEDHAEVENAKNANKYGDK